MKEWIRHDRSGMGPAVLVLLLFAMMPSAVSAQVDAMHIDVEGKVGIGTETPGTPLHIYRDNGTARILVEEASPTTASRDLFEIRNNGRAEFRITDTAPGSRSWTFSNALGGNSFIITAAGTGVNEMKLDAGGNVTFTGNITVLQPGSSIPDHVFDPGHGLMSLSELEQFVHDNRHLPGVPSSNQIGESGLDMTEMQLALLEKIEELVLYTIEQQRLIEQQSEQIAELKSCLDDPQR